MDGAHEVAVGVIDVDLEPADNLATVWRVKEVYANKKLPKLVANYLESTCCINVIAAFGKSVF